MTATPEEIVEFWFGTPNEDGTVAKETSARWWKKDAAFDQEIRDRFGTAIEAAAAGELEPWLDTSHGTIAYILLLDQFTRNAFRNTAKMYAADARAQAASLRAFDEHFAQLAPMQRYFALMPLMHAEDRGHQDLCVERFEALLASCEGPLAETYRSAVDYAVRHRDIVAEFGRFPHRNEILDRESTSEERQFLTKPGSSF